MSMTIDANTDGAAPILPIQPIGDQVVVWAKSPCVQCTATYRKLNDSGVEYQVLDLAEYPDAVEALRAANYLQAPVVQTADDIWSGFRPDKIDAIAQAVAA